MGASGLRLLAELRRRAKQLLLAARRSVSVLRLERSEGTTLQHLPKICLSKASRVAVPMSMSQVTSIIESPRNNNGEKALDPHPRALRDHNHRMPPRRHRPRQVLQAAVLTLQLDRRLGDEAEVDVAGGEGRVRRDETAAQPRQDASVLSAVRSLSAAGCAACQVIVFNIPERKTSEPSRQKPDVRTRSQMSERSDI